MSVFGVILVRIFSDSDWIRRDTEYLSGDCNEDCKRFLLSPPKFWDLMSDNFPSLNVEALKQNFRKWKSNSCPRRLCRVYVNNVGSLWYDIQLEFFLLWNQLNENKVLRYILWRQKPDYFSYLQSFLCFILKPVSWFALQVSRIVFTSNWEM